MIVVLGYAVLLKYAGWIIFAVFCYLILKVGVPQFLKWRRESRWHRWADDEEAREYQEQIDRENREWIESGIYEGEYPGYTMPLTAPGWYQADDEGFDPDAVSTLPPDWSGIVRPK